MFKDIKIATVSSQYRSTLERAKIGSKLVFKSIGFDLIVLKVDNETCEVLKIR